VRKGKRAEGKGAGSNGWRNLGAAREKRDTGAGALGEPGQALSELGMALWKFCPHNLRWLRTKALPRRSAGPPCSPAPSRCAPAVPASQRGGRGPRARRGAQPGQRVPGVRRKVLAGGTGREKDLLDLGRRGHTFPALESGLASHPLKSPTPFLPVSFPSLALLCSRGRNELGALLLEPGAVPLAPGVASCPGGCCWPWREDEDRAVEQVVLEIE
jgi:hypothetical protein